MVDDAYPIWRTKPIANCTIEQLKEEIRRRKGIKEAGPAPAVSERVLTWMPGEFRPVLELVSAEIASIKEHGRSFKDADHQIYEATMKAFFGKDVFKWINKRCAENEE